MTFEQIFTYATLGLTALHKLVDVAKWAAGALTPDDPRDDAWVVKIEGWLGVASRALGFLPALRQGVKK